MKLPSNDFVRSMYQAPSKCINTGMKVDIGLFQKVNPNIWKITFVLGSYEYLKRLEGKIFFYAKIFKNNSVVQPDKIWKKHLMAQHNFQYHFYVKNANQSPEILPKLFDDVILYIQYTANIYDQITMEL